MYYILLAGKKAVLGSSLCIWEKICRETASEDMKWIDLASVSVRLGRFCTRGSGYMATKITPAIFIKNDNQMRLRFH
jgi:hypothetical protein